MFYHYLKLQMREYIISRVGRREYSKVCERLKINRWINDVEIIKFEGIEIVGCTITGLAKYRGLISALIPTIMVIEEVAETWEVNIAAAMFPSLKQLAFVGDHKQLIPYVTVHCLCKPPLIVGQATSFKAFRPLNPDLFESIVIMEMNLSLRSHRA